jgi:hypothetical protein
MKRLFVCLCASLFAGLSLSAENLLKESFRTVDLVTTPEKAGKMNIKNMCLEPAEGTGEKPKTPEEIAAEQAKKGEARRQEVAAIDAAAPKLGENGTIVVSPDWRTQPIKNLVTAGGLDWAYDISGAINGFALDDPSVIYETHVYPWRGNWEKKFLATAEKYPVLLGEVGASDKKMPFESKLKDPHKWSKKVLACIQKNHLNWTGWSFHPGASPCLLKKGGGFEPTEYWGVYAKDALAGRQFSSEE